MNIHISTTNSKLGPIMSINLPALITCIQNAPCARECYARHGHFIFDNVRQSHLDNLNAYKEDPDAFFDFIAEKTRLSRYFRYHSSGDIVDANYLDGMCRVARKNKGTEYLAFTKKFALVNGYVSEGHKIPKNLHIVFSGWDNAFKIDNPYNFPTTWVLFREKERNANIPETAIPCAGKCDKCLACWQLKSGQAVYFRKH